MERQSPNFIILAWLLIYKTLGSISDIKPMPGWTSINLHFFCSNFITNILIQPFYIYTAVFRIFGHDSLQQLQYIFLIFIDSTMSNMTYLSHMKIFNLIDSLLYSVRHRKGTCYNLNFKLAKGIISLCTMHFAYVTT